MSAGERSNAPMREVPAKMALLLLVGGAACGSSSSEPADRPVTPKAPAALPKIDAKAVAAARDRSPIKSDEVVMVFDTAAWKDDAGWHVPLHAWIYEPELDSWRREAFVEALAEVVGDAAEDSPLFRERVTPFLYDNERGKALSVAVSPKVVTLPESSASGHCRGEVILDRAPELTAKLQVLARADDAREFTGTTFFVPEQGLTIISDIDDTVKISNVTDKPTLLRKTFVEPFEAVPKIAVRYRAWLDAAPGGHLHFVSASPWQLYPALSTFLREAGFPPATWSLKTLRIKDPKVLEVLDSTQATKIATIAEHIERYPQRRFALIGDSGEHDPEVYGAIARRFGEQIVYIAIRNVTGEAAGDARFVTAFKSVSTKWELFDDVDAMTGPPPPA